VDETRQPLAAQIGQGTACGEIGRAPRPSGEKEAAACVNEAAATARYQCTIKTCHGQVLFLQDL
jgi:hypothetical protein